MNQAAGRFVALSVLGAAILGVITLLSFRDYRPGFGGSALKPVSMPVPVIASNRAYMPGVRIDGDVQP